MKAVRKKNISELPVSVSSIKRGDYQSLYLALLSKPKIQGTNNWDLTEQGVLSSFASITRSQTH